MFQAAELERLRLQKDLLVLQSDVNRLLLKAECERLRAPQTWLNEAASLARRHPLWAAALATAAGMLAVQGLLKSGSVGVGFGRLGKVASMAFSVWKLFRPEKPEP
jgi:hypothetical protein